MSRLVRRGWWRAGVGGTATCALAALAAAGASRSGSPAGLVAPAAGLLGGLTVGALLALSCFGVVALRPMLRRLPPDRQHAADPVPVPGMLIGLLALALVGAIALALVQLGRRHEPPVGSGSPGVVTGSAPRHRVTGGRPLGTATIVAASASVLLVLAGAGAVLVSGRRRPSSGRPARRFADLRAALAAAHAAAAAEPDPRRSIIAAYVEMDEALSRAGLAWRPSEAPREHLRRALAELQVEAPAAHELTALYERARFGAEDIAASDRGNALTALDAVRAALGDTT